MSASIAINNSKNNNKNKEKKSKKLSKTVKSVRLSKSVQSVASCDCRAMHRLSTSSAPTLSPPLRTKCKIHLSSPTSQSTEDDINDMPVLTPEVPFEVDIGPPALENIVKPLSPDLNYVDLSAPPVLSPALDDQSKSKSGNSKIKRKHKSDTTKGSHDLTASPYQLSDINCDNIFVSDMKSAKKVKTSQKNTKLFDLNKTKQKCNQNIFEEKSIKIGKELEESSRKLFKVLNNKTKSKSKLNFKTNGNTFNGNATNGWSVDSNHTMSSVNSSVQTSQPFMKSSNFDETTANRMDCAQNESLLAHNSSIFDNSFKFRQKLIKKSKTALNSLSMRVEANKAPNKALFNELIGVQKPEPEIDEIEGIRFQSFETEDSINLFTKFEQLEKEQREQSSLSKTYNIKSLKSGKLIFPTKTKDITKIKGWREKLFSSLDEKQTNRSIDLSKISDKKQSKENSFNSFISDPMGQSSSSGSKSAFVSDLLDGYLKTKSDLKFNYLNPDFAAPPDDSPIFSASVLKMPDFGSMPPPLTPSSSQSSFNKKKTKGMKNKSHFETVLSDSMQSEVEDDLRERLLPQYPVIQETLWPDLPLNDDKLSQLYNDYIEFTYNEMQQMKRSSVPSLVMDDNYARFALSALQCNTRIPFISDSEQPPEDVLIAVGLAPKQKSPSPVKETKITGRYRKDKEADIAKIIAMGNRSKRQIRLPSRFHESSLLLGNQWIIPDYDQKGKTGKRRLQEEQRRLQELHQKQLELDQRNHPVISLDTNTTTTDDKQLSLIHKKLSNGTKSKLNQQLNIPTISKEYPLKIPHQRLKQIQLIRKQKKLMNSSKQTAENGPQKMDKSFTSLFSMSTQTSSDKRVLSLSAKAAASANQRAQVNQLFLQLSEVINTDKHSMVCRNGKLNKLETIKDAIETIEKLTKREQQLSYIRKLLSMWNHKLQLCHKVAQKGLKPEAHKVVTDVMNTYRNSMCYKVGEALEAKRKEFQQKRAQQLAQQSTSQVSKKPQLSTGTQVLTIPTAKSKMDLFKMPTKTPKALTGQRLILPKLPILNKDIKTVKNKSETIVNTPNIYPKLMTPELLQKNVSDLTFDTELIGRESSLLKPPVLTTRPTILKPFIISPNEGHHSSTSVSGPVINVPDISRYKSMSKSLNLSSVPSSLMSSSKCHTIPSINSTPVSAGARLKLPFNTISVPTTIPSVSSSLVSNTQNKSSKLFSPQSYAGKNVIITYETTNKSTEDINRIFASINSNSDLKKLPVRFNNGMAALSIPGSSNIASSTSKGSNIMANTPTISAPSLQRNRGNSSESIEEIKSQKFIKIQATNPSVSSSQSTLPKSNSIQKQMKVNERVVTVHTDSAECIEID